MKACRAGMSLISLNMSKCSIGGLMRLLREAPILTTSASTRAELLESMAASVLIRSISFC